MYLRLYGQSYTNHGLPHVHYGIAYHAYHQPELLIWGLGPPAEGPPPPMSGPGPPAEGPGGGGGARTALLHRGRRRCGTREGGRGARGAGGG